MRMKKIFICAVGIGLAAGVIYWLYNKEKSNRIATKSADNKVEFEPSPQDTPLTQGSNIVEEMYQTKMESVQAVYERHSKTGEIMKDAYSNIMEDFVEDFSDEKDENAKDESKEVIIDSESVSVIKEIDSISDELDDLLK